MYGSGEQLGRELNTELGSHVKRSAILHTADGLIHLPCRHLLLIERTQEIDREAVRIGTQPTVVIYLWNDHRHPAVQRLHDLIRIGRDDREGQQLSIRLAILPSFPQPGQRIGVAVFHCDSKWLFVLRIELLPFVERISRHKAAPY
jgi:hypothetical protein